VLLKKKTVFLIEVEPARLLQGMWADGKSAVFPANWS